MRTRITRSSTLSIRLLRTFFKLDRDTDVLIRSIISWASIVDLKKLLLLNHAKECDHWKSLLEIVQMPFHRCQECSDEYYNYEEEDGIGFPILSKPYGNIRHPCGGEGPYHEDPRVKQTFKDLSPYAACIKLMPVAQKYIKNLLSFHDRQFYPEV
jgi:hypothetical protein